MAVGKNRAIANLALEITLVVSLLFPNSQHLEAESKKND